MSQTSYSNTQTAAYAGMLADMSNHDAVSLTSEEASAEIPFGVVVAFGSAEGLAELPDGSGDKLCGVVLHSHTYDRDEQLGDDGLLPESMMSVLRKGRVYVQVEEAVSPGDRLYVRYATGSGGTQLGACRKSAVSNETIDATAQGVFLTSASEDGFAVLEVDFTNKP